MRALQTARAIAQSLANRENRTYVIWAIGWRTLTLPEGKDVQGGVVLEYVNPQTSEVIA